MYLSLVGMTRDELQRCAGTIRWVGLAVTFVGVLITGAGYYVADLLASAQKQEKGEAHARLQRAQSA